MEKAWKKHSIHILVFAFFLLTAILHCFVHYAYDDFYYATFLDHGVLGFVKNMVQHHKTLTGRSLVHTILCPLLTHNMVPFRVFNVCLITAVHLVTARICLKEKKQCFPALAFSFSLFYTMGISVLSDGVLWGAGSLNYLFPAFFILVYYFLYQNAVTQNRTPRYLPFVAFFSGATVEMSGILAVMTSVFFVFVSPSYRKTHKRFCFLNLLCSFLGWLSLFCTEGVGKRLAESAEEGGSVLATVMVNFSLFCRKICAGNGLGLLLFFAVLLFVLLSAGCRAKKAFWFGCAAELFLSFVLLGVWYHNVLVMATAVFVFLYLCAMAVFMAKKQDTVILFFMLCIVISQGVCMVSPVVGSRMLLPTGIYLAVIAVRLFVLEDFRRPVGGVFCIVAMLALTAGVFYSVNYAKNDAVLRENYRQTQIQRREETLTLSNVYDERFGSGTVPTATNFGSSYLLHFQLNATAIEPINRVQAKLYAGDTVLTQQAVMRGGSWYVPVRLAKELFDTRVSWQMASAVAEVKGTVYRFTNGAKTADLGKAFLRSRPLRRPVRMINDVTYISLEDFNEIFEADLKTE